MTGLRPCVQWVWRERETHAREALTVLKEMAPLLDELQLHPEMTFEEMLVHMEAMVANDREAQKREMDKRRDEQEKERLEGIKATLVEAGLDPDDLLGSLPDQTTVFPKGLAHAIRDYVDHLGFPYKGQVAITFLGAPDYEAAVKKKGAL